MTRPVGHSGEREPARPAEAPEGARIEDRLRQKARALGFGLFGIATADPTQHMAFYRAWVGDGRHGEMAYLARADALARRADLRLTMEGVRSVVVVGHEYHRPDAPEALADPSRAVVAQYARGADYHDVVGKRLRELLRWLDAEHEHPVGGRVYVDTGPILERDLARRAGLGWFGKNTMLISPARGSYFFLGLLLLDVELEPTEPFEEDRCGTCSACLDACPTDALLGRDASGAPVIDARRCISYLTIELRGAIPRALRSGIGNRIFGCDICQEVCPWNVRFAEPSAEGAYDPSPELDLPHLTRLADELLELDDRGFRARFRRSPLWRARREGLLRNVCVGLGNRLSVPEAPEAAEAVRLLERALTDAHPLVRGHAAWALGQDRAGRSDVALRARLEVEPDEWVSSELRAALDAASER